MNTVFAELVRCGHTIEERNQRQYLTMVNAPTGPAVGYREMVVISGTNVTDGNGARRIDVAPSGSFTWYEHGFAGLYCLPAYPDGIPDSDYPLRVVFEQRAPHIIATPLGNGGNDIHVEAIAPAVSEQGDLSLESQEEILTWPIGEAKWRWGTAAGEALWAPLIFPGPYRFATLPDDLFFLSLIIRTTDTNGRPAAGVPFSWQVKGTMRYLSKRTQP